MVIRRRLDLVVYVNRWDEFYTARSATTTNENGLRWRIRLKFDSVAKLAKCPDHSGNADSLGLFADRRAPFLIANAFIQDHPDQLTYAMRNCPDGFVVAETRNETTVDDLLPLRLTAALAA